MGSFLHSYDPAWVAPKRKNNFICWWGHQKVPMCQWGTQKSLSASGSYEPADCKLPIWFQQVSVGLYDLSILTCFCGPWLKPRLLVDSFYWLQQNRSSYRAFWLNWPVTRVVIRRSASGIFSSFYELELISSVPFCLETKNFIHFDPIGPEWWNWWHETLSEGRSKLTNKK